MKLSEIKKFPPVCPDQPYFLHGGDYNPDQWLDRPDILEEDVRLMKLAHINSASVAIFAWKALEPEEGVYRWEWLDETLDRLWENGVSVILATPSGARPDWMDRDHPEVLRMNEHRVRNLHGGRHNHCYTSPYYRSKVQQMNRLLAERYGQHPAVKMWHVSNEYGGECHCPVCQQAFRDWLRQKYKTIDQLNHQWWTAFWSHSYSSFDEIESPAPHGETSVTGLDLDWKRFVTYQTAEFIKAEIQPLKEITPNLPVTINMMELFEGLDYWKLAPLVDVISWDSYPFWHSDQMSLLKMAVKTAFNHDLFRSLKKKPFMLMESTPSLVNWAPVNKLKRPGMHALSSIQAVAHGSDSVQYFQWRKGRGGAEKLHGAVIDHCGHENTRVFHDVAALGSLLEKLTPIAGSCVEPDVAILFDWDNRWAIDKIQGLSHNRNYAQTCMQHYSAFWKLGIPCDIIDMDQPLDSYKLVVAPMLYMLKPGVADRMKDFVRKGGQLVLTYLSGYVNENDLCFLGGFPGDGMQQLCGVWAEEIDSLYPSDQNGLQTENGCFAVVDYCERIHPLEGCQVIGEYTSDFYAGEPALTCNRYGNGKCWYIACRTGEDFLDTFYRQLAEELSLLPGWIGSLPEGVSVQPRGADGKTWLFFMNFSENPQSVALYQEMVDMADGSVHRDILHLPPFGVRVLQLNH